MGIKFTAEDNNRVYKLYPKFKDKWTLSNWLNLWCEVYIKINNINKQENDHPYKTLPIIELGCGTGQFAEMMSYLGVINPNNYRGYDFSDYAISIARSKCRDLDFIIQDIEQIKPDIFFKGKNLVIMLEVLEHCDDFEVLSKIPNGSIVLASVPDFDAQDHIRHFSNVDEVTERYSKYLDLEYCYKFQNFYIFKGVKIMETYEEKSYWTERVKKNGYIHQTLTGVSDIERDYLEKYLFQGAKVLDYGGGDGKMTELYQKYDCDVVFLDIVEDFREILKKRIKDCGYTFKHKYFIQEPYTPFKMNKNFDLIISTAVLMHVRPEYIDWALCEFKRLAKGKAKVVCINYENRENRNIQMCFHNFNHDYEMLLKKNGISPYEYIYKNEVAFFSF